MSRHNQFSLHKATQKLGRMSCKTTGPPGHRSMRQYMPEGEEPEQIKILGGREACSCGISADIRDKLLTSSKAINSE